MSGKECARKREHQAKEGLCGEGLSTCEEQQDTWTGRRWVGKGFLSLRRKDFAV